MTTFKEILAQADAEHTAKLKAEQSMIFSYNRSGTWGRTPDPIQWPEDGTDIPEFVTRYKHGYSGDGDIYPHGSSDIGWHYTVWEGPDSSFIVSVSTYNQGHDIYTRELPDFLALIAHLESTLCALVYPKVDGDA